LLKVVHISPSFNGKSSAGTILLFELHPPLSRLHIKCWVFQLTASHWTT